ncbi:toll-like receptor 3 [Aplysia californica]|uniref:Toll-like receptor 3 n=1 Tax=Aplysia californica TaxID=6500 RepID=A0ABM0ZZY8_APLCA|nr:toll-like receptor 3 [Aplysia californica]
MTSQRAVYHIMVLLWSCTTFMAAGEDGNHLQLDHPGSAKVDEAVVNIVSEMYRDYRALSLARDAYALGNEHQRYLNGHAGEHVPTGIGIPDTLTFLRGHTSRADNRPQAAAVSSLKQQWHIEADHGEQVEKNVKMNISLNDKKHSTVQFPPSGSISSDNVVGASVGISRHLRDTSGSLIKRYCDVHGRTQVCFQRGQSRCVCKGGLADCSGQRYVPNIGYVPRLPKTTKCLKFTQNNVRALTESYFANVSTILVLDFSSNNLQIVSKKTFKRFTNLQYLILNHNPISYKYLRYVFDYPPRLRLDIIDLNLKDIPHAFFLPHSNINTSQLFMDFNYFKHLNLSEFSHLKNLQYLSVNNCSIQNLTSSNMPRLKVLDLDYNSLSTFPVTCKEVRTRLDRDEGEKSKHPKVDSYFSSLTDLYLGINDISWLPGGADLCLPRVESLHLNSNKMVTLQANAFTGFPSLKVLILDKMKPGFSSIGPAAFGTKSLVSLHLSKSNVDFRGGNISLDMFAGTSSLKVLHLDHNPLGAINESALGTLLSHASTVFYLYLGSTGLVTFPSQALAQMAQLKSLYIYLNHIKDIPGGALDLLQSLILLDANQNDITFVGEMSTDTQKRFKSINLSRNKYLCTCDLLPFQAWLKEAGPTVFKNYTQYLCSDRPSVRVWEYKLSHQACLLSRKTYILFVVFFSLFVAAFLIFVVLYRYRWSIRLALYERQATSRGLPLVNPEGQEFQYDLFIVYCNDDGDWVEDELLYVVEEMWGLHTCVHRRDFIAGHFIVDNIVAAMNASRRVLVVVSSQFARSEWCNYELLLCQSHIITHELPSLLVIKLDSIESRDMSAAMLGLYNSTCFLEWDSNEIDHTFWRRLRGSLQLLIQQRAAQDAQGQLVH